DGSALMSFEVAKRAVDFLIENSGSHYNLDIDFFGGEPLLNFDVVKQTVAYARSIEKQHKKHFRFTLTTNGILLDDEIGDYLNQNMHNVVLSLDGRKEVHDRFRVNKAGRGSYDIVVPKFINFAKKRRPQEFYIRATFTRHNLDFFNDILHLLNLGFNELSMEPVVAPAESPESIREEDLPIIFKQYELLAEEMIKRSHEGRPFEFYHFNINLEEGPCAYKLLSGCGTGCEYLAVTPSGELYPCHQFVGDKNFLMGDVFDGIKKQDMRCDFAKNNLYAHKECKDCYAKYFCAGGCAANNYHASNNIAGTYPIGCAIFKKRLECALAVNALR
ncbi:MAG: thioether cross-link-forming SCIFF peptide maturase, partial [Eubacteriales bacterium]|nr:thioether cross-link-forming SCIFF peptide maturase [Eubacteriales bacterium]